MGIVMGRHTPGRLSPAEVNRLKRASVEREKLVPDGGNLYLQLKPGGGCSWIFRYEHDGKRHDLGLGSAHTVLLSEAREEATGLRRRLLALRKGDTGLDPLGQRRAAQQRAKLDAAKAISFRQCA